MNYFFKRCRPVPQLPTHTGAICVKTMEPNISSFGLFTRFCCPCLMWGVWRSVCQRWRGRRYPAPCRRPLVAHAAKDPRECAANIYCNATVKKKNNVMAEMMRTWQWLTIYLSDFIPKIICRFLGDIDGFLRVLTRIKYCTDAIISWV
jgi:hypothetical protein